MSAVIVLGHGSLASGVPEQMDQVANALAMRLPHLTVRAAHRELCEPNFESVAADLVRQGHARIVVLPYFLHNGHHLQRDIPEQLSALRVAFPNTDFVLAEHLGFDDRILPVLEDRLRVAMQQGE
jgi:sirohydrochlorin ferrochelatase